MKALMTPLAALAVLLPLCLAACDDSASKAQKMVNSAQADADKVSAEARADADKKVKAAQAEADKKIIDIQTAFTTSREDYRHSVQTSLDDLDRKIAELDAKSKTATGKAKTDLDAKLATIHTDRDAFGRDFKSAATSTSENWDAMKTHLDKSWSELKSAVDHM